MSSDLLKKTYPWAVVGLLWVVALLNYMDRQMLSTMRPSMMIDISELESATNFGYLMAIFLWVYGLVSPISGIVADRWDRKWLITGSLSVWSSVTVAMGYATSFEQLYGLRAIMGLSEALYIPAALSLIADYHPSKTKSLAIGIHMTGLYAGQALGGFGATIASSYSWHQAFQFFGFVGIVYSFVLVVFLREADKREPDVLRVRRAGVQEEELRFGGYRALLTNVAFWIILLAFTASSLPGWGVRNWLPTLFSHALQIDMAQAGPLSTITIAVSSLLGVIIGGLASDRWVQTNIRGRVYISAIGLALTIPSLILVGLGNSLVHVVSAAFCFGLGYGMFDANNMPLVCQFVDVRYRATAYGIMNLAGVLGGALITNILGKSMDAGSLGKSFAVLSIVVLFAVIIQLNVLGKRVIIHRDA